MAKSTSAPAAPDSKGPPPLTSIEDFLFGAPLYAPYGLNSASSAPFDSIYHQMFVAPLVVDGHCPDCRASSTFSRSLTKAVLPTNYSHLELICARCVNHRIHFWFRFSDDLIEKVGQYPSLADIANDESRLYKMVLEAQDAAELHRAIGLAAHGVGVGSFVYIRRVFERLIKRRFLEFQQQEGWENADFDRKRMDEKIDLLKDHLPDFLVRNKNIYAILSLGLHELEESACLDAFEMLKHAIFFILNEDKHKKEELQLRKKVESAISSYSTKG